MTGIKTASALPLFDGSAEEIIGNFFYYLDKDYPGRLKTWGYHTFTNSKNQNYTILYYGTAEEEADKSKKIISALG